MRQECFNGTFRGHVYILLRNVHTKYSANVSWIFLMKTFKIYPLRTSPTHTMRIKKDIILKNMFKLCANNVFSEHSEITFISCSETIIQNILRTYKAHSQGTR